MTAGIDYAQTHAYLQHFRDQGCDANIIAHTEGLFNLCWLYVDMIDELKQELEKKTVNIVRLNDIIYGSSHCAKNTAESETNPAEPPPAAADNTTPNTHKKKAKGHGRHGADDYTGAQVVACECEDVKEGDACPQCHLGKLRDKLPSVKIHIDGSLPLYATRYELEQLTCTHCDFVVTAQAPVDLSKKYTEKAKATLAYLHYGMGLPYYRLAKMQDMLGIPLAVSTQSELIASMMGPVHAVFNHLVDYAAQADCIYQDDTGVKIQSLLQENKNHKPKRKGMYTSGFIAEAEHRVVLFFSGRAHAGENFDELIAHRKPDKGPVIRMADALAANSKHEADAIETKCAAHAFRRFRSLLGTYPEQARVVMTTYGHVYDHDDHCKQHDYTDEQRLTYHRQHSQPLMDRLKAWAEQELKQRRAEPNGVLATECQYLITHWLGLTQFLRVPGAPIDNNVLEAMIKTMITYRKNSQCFRTQYSADYGSRLISVIVTCRVNGINAIDYLTALQRHEHAVWENPNAWLPWHYQETLHQTSREDLQRAA